MLLRRSRHPRLRHHRSHCDQESVPHQTRFRNSLHTQSIVMNATYLDLQMLHLPVQYKGIAAEEKAQAVIFHLCVKNTSINYIIQCKYPCWQVDFYCINQDYIIAAVWLRSTPSVCVTEIKSNPSSEVK